MAPKRMNSFEADVIAKCAKITEEQDVNRLKTNIKNRREVFISALDQIYRVHVSEMQTLTEKISGMCKDSCFSVQYTINTLRKIRETKAPADDGYYKLREFFETDYDVLFMSVTDNSFLNDFEDTCSMVYEDMDKLYLTVFKEFLEEDPEVCQC